MDKFSNLALHVVMRGRLCNKLHDIFVSKEFTGQWSYNTCPSGGALVHLEAILSIIFVMAYFLKIEENDEVPLKDRMNMSIRKGNCQIFMILRKKH